MKKMMKYFLGMVMAMVLCMIPAVSAEAAADGSSIENAMSLTNGKVYTYTCDYNTSYNSKLFYKMVIPADGKVTFTLNSPKINTGGYAAWKIEIYDSAKNVIWAFDDNSYEATATAAQVQKSFWVGIGKGTYYVNISFMDFLGRNETATGNYSVSYEKDSLCETENNGTAQLADTLALNVMRTANIGDYKTGQDWYKVYLQKGQTYYINLGNYETLHKDTFIDEFLLPDGSREYNIIFEKNKEGVYSAEYVAPVSGVYYLKFWNMFNCDGELPIDYQVGVSTSKNVSVNTGKTGLAQAANGNWYYYKNGSINTSFTGLVQFAGNWWYVEKGAVAFKTTLVQYGGQWWYVKNGAVNFSTGLVQYGGQWWYVKNGAVSFTTTLVPFAGNWWYVKNGAVSFTNTLVQYGGSWWYVKNGAVSFTTTLVPFAGKWWFVKNGAVDFSYSGKVPYAGKYWNVKNGVVVF